MDTQELQKYLNKEFQGRDSFLETILYPIFGENNFNDAWDVDVLDDEDLLGLAQRTGIKSAIKYGTFDLPHNTIDIFEVTVSNRVQMQRNRVNIQQLVRRIMDTYSSAFIIFHYDSSEVWDWRFSFCQKDDKNLTEAKRYTFLLGPGQSCRTAADNFHKLFSLHGNVSRDDIVKAFDVEALSKEFFEKYKQHYETFCQFVYDNKDNREYFGEEFSKWEDKTIRDYVKKLLGRIVFLHFLQKKGWMGVPADKDWGDGDMDFMRHLFLSATESQKNNYLDEVLEDLFSKALDTDRTANSDLYDTKVEGFRNVKIPYLNGGLFECDYLDEPKSRFDAELFDKLFEFFYQYNFTIDENDPNDAQVGVDPEMLGRIFENLLEDNKDKGAFYTPKEIVQYMCKESLIAYLQTDVKGEGTKNAIRNFVTTYDVDVLGGKDSATAKDIDELLKSVKICDPAIGSGAFPMGLLKELFYCRGAIEAFDNAAEIKRHIIQQNIYGVDIEKGAVDIARLRFWLALIVDEKTPHALPNMDFKIMQGNSLLEQYKGFDLSTIMMSKKKVEGPVQMTFFEDNVDDLRRQLIALRKEYFKTADKESKESLRKNMRRIVQAQIDATINQFSAKLGDKKSEIVKIDSLDIASTKEFFLWHTWFDDVFDDGGFDIVIGNPPYIDSETMVKVMPEVREQYAKLYATAKGNWDIYIPFYELGIKMLSKNGILGFITPNKWVSIGYGKKLRELYFDNFFLVCDCSKVKVFEAGNEPLICFFSKTPVKNIVLWSALSHGFRFMDTISKSRLNEDSLGMILSDDLDLLLKINKTTSSVADYNSSENPFSTGEAYELCQYVKENSSVSCQSYKLINTGTIDPFISLWGIKTTSYLKSKYEYPVVSRSDFSNAFPRRVRQTGPKIIITGMRYFEVFYDQNGEYIAGKSTIIIPTLEKTQEQTLYLLGILNSSLIQYYINQSYSTLGIGGGINFSTNMVDALPIPQFTKGSSQKLIELVNTLLESNFESQRKIREEINEHVFNLYGLDEADKNKIRNSVRKKK